jgi:hypothetical protein
MSLSCIQIDLKLGLTLTYPLLEIEHSYLEHLLRVEGRLSTAQLWTGKLYDGVTSEDLERLDRQGKTILFASGRTAYFADSATAEFIAKKLYQHPSDAVAYGSLPVSAAQASTVISDRRTKLLVLDDENPEQLPVLNVGKPNLESTLELAATKLGDCYMLITPELATRVQAKPGTPFQFRAATPDLMGMMKGTSRVSENCNELGVDAIIPLSSTKGHGKTIPPGLYEVNQFFLSRKSDAQLREQKLGIQALVNLPEGTIAEILPRLQEDAKRLSVIAQDPRQIAKLYVQSAERRQSRVEPNDGDIQTAATAKVDWLSEVLKGDPTYQLLQHDRVQERLQKFLSGEWEDIATGGIYVPQAMAQPHRSLVNGEVCVPSMLHGERLALYRSPVANVAAFDVFVNNVNKLQQDDPEAFQQQGVCYLNPEDAKRLVIDFDGDTVALIRERDFPVLVQEIQEKNRPEQKPIQVQKEPKIPRSWNRGQTYWQALSVAAIEAANNQVGLVANQGMTMESFRQEINYLPDEQKVTYLMQVGEHWQGLLNAAVDRKLEIPTNAKLEREGFAPYSFPERILGVVQTARTLSKQPLEQREQIVGDCLAQVQQILFQTQSLVAVNLQRAVDAPKSAREIDQQYQSFARALVGYKPHEVMLNKKAPNLYRSSKVIPANTCDPIGLMVKQANQYYGQAQLPVQERKHFKALFPKPEETVLPAVQDFVEQYNRLIRQATQDGEQNNTNPNLILISGTSGRHLDVRDALKLNPAIDSLVWDALRSANSLDVIITPNEVVSQSVGTEYVAKLRFNEHIIGFVSKENLEQQGVHLNTQQRLMIAKAQFKVRASDEEVSKKTFKQSQHLLEQFASSIPASDRSAVAAYLWHNGGQAICLKAFPQEVLQQIQAQTMKLTVIGLQYPTNELPGRIWQGETVAIRTALETNPNSPNHNRAILQVQDAGTWKTLGVVSGEGMTQLPIDTQAQATIHAAISQATTARGNTFEIRNLDSYDWPATAQMRFYSQGKQAVVSLEHDGQWRKFGTVDQKTATRLRELDLVDTRKSLPGVALTALPGTTAQIQLERDTIQYPAQWQLPNETQTKWPTPQPSTPEINDYQQGRESAIAAIALLKNFPVQADGSREFHGQHWEIRQQDKNLSITNKADQRLILNVQEGNLTQFSPRADDHEKLAWLRSHYGQPVQQQSAPRQRLSC